LLASGARAESGGVISLFGSVISTSSTSAADNDPSSAARVLSGGLLQLSNSTITTTGQRGDGISVQDVGSRAIVSDSSISVSGTRAPAAFIFNGGQATFTNSSLLSTNNTGVLVQDAGSTIDLTNTAIRSTGAVGYGLRVVSGGSATMTGGSSITEGRDGPALYAANGTINATNVTIRTSGTDNAMGVLADLNGQITLNGGTVTTTGDAVRLSSFPHGLAARNPNGTLTSFGTTVLTTGNVAMGAVADDGGSVFLTGNSIRTLGPGSVGLFSTVEQAGPQFPATLTANGITVETSGLGAHGALASQHFLDAPSITTLNDSSVTTHGDLAAGLRAITAGTVNSNRSSVFTEEPAQTVCTPETTAARSISSTPRSLPPAPMRMVGSRKPGACLRASIPRSGQPAPTHRRFTSPVHQGSSQMRILSAAR
jgi:autotransporter family porin